MAEKPPTRRAVLSTLTALVTTGAVASVVYKGTEPAVATEPNGGFSAGDVRTEHNDGRLDRVTTAPDIAVSWRDFTGGLDAIESTLTASIADERGFDELVRTRIEEPDAVEDPTVRGDGFDSTSGELRLEFDRIDLTAVGDAVTVDDFGGDLDPGTAATTPVELALRIDVVGNAGDRVESVQTAQFDVTVHNPEGTATTDGSAETDAA